MKNKIIREIFEFNRRFIPEKLSPEERYECMQRFGMCSVDELIEVLNELPFEHWKEYELDDIDEQMIAEELIFTFGMVDTMGLDEDDILNEIAKKNRINNKRQEEGY